MTSVSGIKELEHTLGRGGVKRFLEHSIPLFRENFEVLQDALEKQDWKEAADMAHKMKATALIFSTQMFNEDLDSVGNQNRALIGSAAFKKNLKQQVDNSLSKICNKYQID